MNAFNKGAIAAIVPDHGGRHSVMAHMQPLLHSVPLTSAMAVTPMGGRDPDRKNPFG
ncbi:MAG: hypothetical protein ACK59Y_01550 [Betaproteobacteria bacterium]|nr:hypothetical protein [Betaproteobacteria bacterium]